MMSSGAQAKQRHDALHQEVLEELRKDKVERDAFLKAKHQQPGDIDGDGFQEHTDDYTPNWTDDHYDEEAARKRDEQWRNEVVEHFAESFAHHFNDTAAKEDGLQPRATLTEADPLFDELTKLGDALGYPGAWDAVSSNERLPDCWREAEKKLKVRTAAQKHRCHPSSLRGAEDDEYDYMQIHNVEHYISEMKWHAKLNSHRDEIVGKLAEHAFLKSRRWSSSSTCTLEGERSSRRSGSSTRRGATTTPVRLPACLPSTCFPVTILALPSPAPASSTAWSSKVQTRPRGA